MPAATSLPVLGAALQIDGLILLRDWIFERHRDLEMQDFAHPDVLLGDWKPRAAEIRRMLTGFRGRLGIHGPFHGFTIATSDPEIRVIVTKRLIQGLDVCDALGADQMVVHSPYTTWEHHNAVTSGGLRQKTLDRVHGVLDPVVRVAEMRGVTLVLENIEDKDPASRVALARSFNNRFVRVSLDTGHANYAYGSTGAPPVDGYVHAAGDMLEHVHLQDTDGYSDRHWPPGEGIIRWVEVFRALATLSSKPRVLLELRDPAQVLPGAAYLAGLGVVV